MAPYSMDLRKRVLVCDPSASWSGGARRAARRPNNTRRQQHYFQRVPTYATAIAVA